MEGAIQAAAPLANAYRLDNTFEEVTTIIALFFLSRLLIRKHLIVSFSLIEEDVRNNLSGVFVQLEV